MLFNSYPFIFLFLPIALIGYFVLGRVGQPGAGDLAGAGVAGVLFRQQLAVCTAAAGVGRVQLFDRLAADRRAAAPHAAICGPDDRRRRRSSGARHLQICRLPRRQSQRAVFDRVYRQHPAAGRDFILHLHPDRVPGRRLPGQCRALRAAALRAVRHLFPASDRGADPASQGHDPAIRARRIEAAGSASDPVRPDHLRDRPVQEDLPRRRHPAAGRARLRRQYRRRSIRPGSARWPIRSSSISISPAIPTWRSAFR